VQRDGKARARPEHAYSHGPVSTRRFYPHPGKLRCLLPLPHVRAGALAPGRRALGRDRSPRLLARGAASPSPARRRAVAAASVQDPRAPAVTVRSLTVRLARVATRALVAWCGSLVWARERWWPWWAGVRGGWPVDVAAARHDQGFCSSRRTRVAPPRVSSVAAAEHERCCSLHAAGS